MRGYEWTHRFDLRDVKHVTVGFFYDASDRVRMWPLYDVLIDDRSVESGQMPDRNDRSGWNQYAIEREIRQKHESDRPV